MLADTWRLEMGDGESSGVWRLQSGGQLGSNEDTALSLGTGPGPTARCAHSAASAADGTIAYIFGGYGVHSGGGSLGSLGDLWQFVETTATWTALPSTTAAPAPRATHAMWTDQNGGVWMHGGEGASGFLSDLWRFTADADAASGSWLAVDPQPEIDAPGSYPTDGVGVTGGRPGGRHRQTVWTSDYDQSVWMMGGEGIDGAGQTGWLGDLWRLDLSITDDSAADTPEPQWTWVGGSDTAAGYAPPLGWGPSGRASMVVLKPSGGDWDPASEGRSRVALFGGYRMLGRASEVLNDCWQLTTAL